MHARIWVMGHWAWRTSVVMRRWWPMSIRRMPGGSILFTVANRRAHNLLAAPPGSRDHDGHLLQEAVEADYSMHRRPLVAVDGMMVSMEMDRQPPNMNRHCHFHILAEDHRRKRSLPVTVESQVGRGIAVRRSVSVTVKAAAFHQRR